MEIYKSSSEAGSEVRSRGQAINNRQVPTEPANPPLAPLRPARTALQPPSETRTPEELFDAINASVWGGGKPDATAPSEPSERDVAFNKINESIFGKAPERSAEAPPQGNKDAGVVSDIGNLLGLGVNNLALSVRELVGRIPGVGQSIVSGLDSIDQWASGKSSEALLKGNIKQGQAALTTETRAAQDKEWWDSDKGTFGEAWSDPRAYMSGVFQSLPEQAVTMFPVMRLAKGIYATRMAGAEAAQLSAANSARTASLNSGATAGNAEIAAVLAAQKALKDLSTQAAAASARAATIAGGLSEGLLAGAGSSREVRDEIMKMTPEQLGQSDAMRTLTDSGMNFETARRTLAEDSATQAFVLSGSVTGLFGGLGDRFLAKAITKGAGTSIVGRTTKGVLTQGGEELPQEYGSKVAQNFALQNANPNLELTEGALNQGLGGLATGGIQGGFTAGVFGKKEGQPETRTVTSSSGPVTVSYEESIDPDQAQGTRQQFTMTDREFADVTQDRDYMAAAYALADDAGRALLSQANPELNLSLASKDPGAIERGTAMINADPQFYEGFVKRLGQTGKADSQGAIDLDGETAAQIQSGVASLDPDMRDLWALTLERKLEKKGELTWRDIPQELIDSVDTISFAGLKAGLAINPRKTIDLIRGAQNNAANNSGNAPFDGGEVPPNIPGPTINVRERMRIAGEEADKGLAETEGVYTTKKQVPSGANQSLTGGPGDTAGDTPEKAVLRQGFEREARNIAEIADPGRQRYLANSAITAMIRNGFTFDEANALFGSYLGTSDVDQDTGDSDDKPPNVSDRLQAFNAILPNILQHDRDVRGQESSPQDYAPGNLTPGLYQIAKLFGINLTGYRYLGKDPMLAKRNGIWTPNGVAINSAARDQFLTLFGHETYHELKRRAPEEAAALEAAVLKYISAEGSSAIRARIERLGYPVEQVNEEVVADILGVMFQDRQFWQQLGMQKPTLLQRIVESIDGMIKRFGALGRRKDSVQQYITDMTAVRDMMAGFVNQRLEAQANGESNNMSGGSRESIEGDPIDQITALAKAGNKMEAAKVFRSSGLYQQMGIPFDTFYADAQRGEKAEKNERVVLTGRSPYLAKDQRKADQANRFIGRGSSLSSTAQYESDFGALANTGTYNSSDVVFVSAEGNRAGRVNPDFDEIDNAISAGVTFITDDQANRERPYNVGEREVAQHLETNGYREVAPGRWQPLQVAPKKAEASPQKTETQDPAATGNTSTPDSGRIKALQLRAGLLADAGRLNAAESAEVSGLLDAGNVSAARSLLDNYSLRTWQKKPTQAEQEQQVQFDKDVEMPPPRPPGQFEDGTAISVGTVSPIVKEPTDLGTASTESEKERKQRVDERAEMYRQSYSDGVARAFIKQSLDPKGDKDILIQTEYEFVDGDRVVGKVFSARGQYFRFNIKRDGSYLAGEGTPDVGRLIAKPPTGSTLRRVRQGLDPQQAKLDLEENKKQADKYRAEVQRIMLTAFSPSGVTSTLAELRRSIAQYFSNPFFKKPKKGLSDVEYIFKMYADVGAMESEGVTPTKVGFDRMSGERVEQTKLGGKGGKAYVDALSKAIRRAQDGDVVARAGLLKTHAAQINDELQALSEKMVENGMSQQQADEIVKPAQESLKSLEDSTSLQDMESGLDERIRKLNELDGDNRQAEIDEILRIKKSLKAPEQELTAQRDEKTLSLPTRAFSDARLAAAAAVDEIVNGTTSPIAIVRRELNKPDREFSFSDLRKEMAARGMDISQIDREVSQWPAAQYSLGYWVMKNSQFMTPYAARLSWFNSHESIMSIYKDDQKMRGQYESELSDVENRFIEAMRAERQAVNNRREETTDEFGQGYSDAKKAFPHALFNKYSLDDMRNLDESSITPEDADVLRSLVGGNSTFLPRLWLDDVAFALDARKDLRPLILEGMGKQERQAVERYLSMSASVMANNERVSALRTYSTMLDNIGELDKAAYDAFKKQIIYADLRAIPRILHRAQEIADITAQAKDKKELGTLLSAYLDKVYQDDERTSRTLDESKEEFDQIAGRGTPDVTDKEIDDYVDKMNRLGEREGGMEREDIKSVLMYEKIAEAAEAEAIAEIQTGIVADENQQAAPTTDQPENQAGLSGDIQYKRGRFSSGPAQATVIAHLRQITYGWKRQPNVQVFYNVDQIADPELRARLTERAESGAFKGAIDPDTGAVYIFSQHVEDLADAEFVMFHELYGHWGLRAFLGDKLNAFLENQYKLNKKIKAEADRQFDAALEDGSPMSRLESVEEAISDLAVKGEPNLFRQLIGQLVNWLRKHDMNTVASWIDSTGSSELAYILGQARKVARTGEGISPFNGAPQSVLYSRANKRPIEIFSQRDGKITGYARMNPVNQYWTVFTIKDIDTGDFGAITVEEVGDATAILKKVGTISKSRDRDTRVDVDPGNLEQIPDYSDLTGWAKFTRNLQMKGQNTFLPVFEVARFLDSKGIKSTVIDDIIKYESRLGYFVTDFEKRFANPIQRSLKALGDKGATVEDVDLYLMARTAKERNEAINKINPTNFSGSGLSTDDAAQIIKDMEARPYINELNEIATLTDQMSKDKVNYMLQTGLINKYQHASLIKYDHYVNLSGNKKLGLDAYDIKSLGGKTFNLKGNDVIRSTGRGTQAVDVLQNTMNSYLSTLMRGQKNRVMMSILQMVEQNPDPTYVAVEPIKERKTVNVERLNFDKKILRVIGDAATEASGREFLDQLKRDIKDGSKDPDEALDDLSAKINEAERRRDIDPAEAKTALGRINEAVVMSGRLSPDGYVSMVEDNSLMLDPAVLVAKSNGKPVVMRFEDRGIEFVQAMTGMNVQESNGLVEGIGKWNRFFSQMVTTWNPAWLPINFIRDIQTAFANASADPNVGAVLAKEMSKQWMPALKAAYKYTRSEQAEMKGKSFRDTLSPEWRDLIEEYFREGGGTFFLDRKGLEATLDKINRHMNGPKGVLQNVEDKLEVVGDFMDLLATPSELAPRLAAYKVLKEAGRSPSEAARYAKELTVNFNMKGSSKSFRALYVFANPAIQGTYRMFQDYSRGEAGIARYMPSNRFAAVAGAWMMLGIVSNYIARAIGGEDEERPGIDMLDTIPGFKRATSLVFMPNMIGGSIPVAYGWNVFSTAGTYMFDTMTGRMKPEVAAGKVLAAAFDSFAPIGSGAESKTLTGRFFKTVLPSPLVPLIELSLNENRFGAPIHKEQTPFSDIKEADAYMHFNSVNPISKGLMQTIARLTSDGNPRYRPGLVDVNPAVMDHMISSYLPGLFSEAYKAVGLAVNKLAGRDVKDMPLPVIGRFEAKTPEGFDTGAMRRVGEKVSTLYKEAMAPDTSEARREQILREHRGLGSTQAILAGTSEQLKTISRNLQAIERNPNLSEKEKIDFRNQMEKLKKQYTKRVVDAAVRSGFQDEVTGNTTDGFVGKAAERLRQ